MKLSILAVAATLGLMASAGSAQAIIVAGATIDITQVGSDVEVLGTGVIDLAGLSLLDTGPSPPSGIVWAELGQVAVGAEGDVDVYSGASGPAAFGSGGEILGSSSLGDLLGVSASSFGVGNPVIVVPAGYVSDTPLSGSATFDHATLASLGLTPGTYVYTWVPVPGAADGSLTVNITSSVVPEPSTWAMMLAGFAGLGYMGYRQRAVLNAT